VSAALRVEGLVKRFGRLEALRGVSFASAPGEIVGVVGPNGAGKTTLLSIIAGVQRATAGRVSGPPAAPDGRSRIGWAPQEPALYVKLSVLENLRLFARLEKLADPEAAAARMLEQADLRERSGERVEALSGGNRQRVNVAVGLIASPPVLALDEPSASLDPAQRERLWRFLAGLARSGTSVVFSTHLVAEAQRNADRVLVLDEGAMRFDGPPTELLRAAGEPAGGDFEAALVRFLAAAAST
jgi:ABC-2 type transport system ATP-binding protein